MLAAGMVLSQVMPVFANSGWQLKDKQWYHFTGNRKDTGWYSEEKNVWYYLGENGAMKTGWNQDSDGNWYYLNKSGQGVEGQMRYGWYQDTDGAWYYLNPEHQGAFGQMQTGTVWIDGRCYYFDKNGRMSGEEKTTDFNALWTNERKKDFENIIKGFVYTNDYEKNFADLNGFLAGKKDLNYDRVSQALGMALYFGLFDDICTHEDFYFVYNKKEFDSRLKELLGQDGSTYLKKDVSKDGTEYRLLMDGDIGAEEPVVTINNSIITTDGIQVHAMDGYENGFEEIETYGEIVYELSYNKNYNKYPFVLKKITQQ